MTNNIESYLESKKKAWSDTSLRTERSRLNAVKDVLNGNPDDLWAHCEEKKLSPYARATLFIRVASFWDFVSPGSNPYREWKKANGRLFKHVYQPKFPDISYEEAKARIAQISNEASRVKALQLLRGGLRWSESSTLRDGSVVGKGAKPRRVYCEAVEYNAAYTTFYRHLRAVGLTPHMLRKIRATDLARKGMNAADLLATFGWQDIKTAQSYLAPLDEARRAELMEE